jgi:hypothetical protein
MQRIHTYYPDYNVLDHQDHWDDHTREIVLKRLKKQGSTQKLTTREADLLRAVAALMLDDGRSAPLDYVIQHMDSKLQSDIGEANRNVSAPPFPVLLIQGLNALNALARREYDSPFTALSAEQQLSLLVALENNTASLITDDGQNVPPKEFFTNVIGEVVSAYYSHPQIWSEIGYGGPAYPRGYVRLEVGLTDPWEARKSGEVT